MLGGQSNPYKYMSRADLYVMPSITEGFPNALVEAMSTETAVLCRLQIWAKRNIIE